MADPLTDARGYGVPVEIVDLGDWGTATLVAEYDPAGPTIRVNARALSSEPQRRREQLAHAVAHELYHHREALGEVARRPTRAAREAAAEAAAMGWRDRRSTKGP